MKIKAIGVFDFSIYFFKIEEKQRLKALERERQRIEDELEEKRIREHEQKLKAEVEEEERKKKAKEEIGKRAADDAKRQADERKRQETSNRKANSKFANKRANTTNNKSNDALNSPPSSAFPLPSQGGEFRSDSPPLPTFAKKINGTKPPTSKSTKPTKPADTTADYFVTESRLNLASPVSFVISFFQKKRI